jgi:8-amino-7-oxononanoate synthase
MNNASSILSLSPTYVIWQGNRLLNFASHDYLGISQHPEMKKNAIKALLHYGTAPCCGEAKQGYVEYQKHIEDKCCQMLGMSELRFFSTRWTALTLLLSQLRSEHAVCFIDVHCDPLLHHAARAWAKVIFYDSRDEESLSLALEQNPGNPPLILTETLFGLQGNNCAFDSLLSIAKKHRAIVIADDSNVFGIHGNKGFGSVPSSIDFLICAMDRAVGSTGAFLAAPLKMELLFKDSPIDPREWSLPYSALGAIDAAFDLIPTMEGERKQLEQRCHWLRMQFKQLDFAVSSTSHFFCFAFAEKQNAESLWQGLLQKEILAELIDATHYGIQRHIVRLSINANHTPEDLRILIATFETMKSLQKNLLIHV